MTVVKSHDTTTAQSRNTFVTFCQRGGASRGTASAIVFSAHICIRPKITTMIPGQQPKFRTRTAPCFREDAGAGSLRPAPKG